MHNNKTISLHNLRAREWVFRAKVSKTHSVSSVQWVFPFANFNKFPKEREREKDKIDDGLKTKPYQDNSLFNFKVFVWNSRCSECNRMTYVSHTFFPGISLVWGLSLTNLLRVDCLSKLFIYCTFFVSFFVELSFPPHSTLSTDETRPRKKDWKKIRKSNETVGQIQLKF